MPLVWFGRKGRPTLGKVVVVVVEEDWVVVVGRVVQQEVWLCPGNG